MNGIALEHNIDQLEMEAYLQPAYSERAPYLLDQQQLEDFITSFSNFLPPENFEEKTTEFLESNRYQGPGPWEYNGRPPSGPGGPSFDPAMLFFYYLQLDHTGALRLGVYKEVTKGKLTDRQLKSLVESLAQKGRNGLAPDFNNFEKAEWHGPCYIAFFLDVESWNYHYQEGKNFSLHFIDRKENQIGTHPQYHANETFHNARDLTFDLEGSNKKALLVENYHMIADGTRRRGTGPVEDDPESYKFDIYYQVKLRQPDGSQKVVDIIVDPTGTNFGPP